MKKMSMKKMSRKFINLTMVLALIFGSMTMNTSVKASEVHPNDYEVITPNLTCALHKYLDEVYVQKYPELATRVLYGTKKEKQEMLTLANMLVKGCKTTQEKVDNIVNWVEDNIRYVSPSCAYGTDTFYLRKGNCYSQSNLIVDLLRSIGIPSVAALGYYANMKMVPPYGDIGSHVWTWINIDGIWKLYDTVYKRYGLTDIDSINSYFFHEIVDGISLEYDGFDLTKNMLEMNFLYRDGKFVSILDNEEQHTWNAYLYTMNDLYMGGIIKQEDDGVEYIENPERRDQMENGDLYTNGWIKKDDVRLIYCYENGMIANNTFVKLGDKEYYAYYANTLDIKMPESKYFLKQGILNIIKGYKGAGIKIAGLESYENNEKYSVEYTSSDDSIIGVSAGGSIDCKKPGKVKFNVTLKNKETEETEKVGGFELEVANEMRVPDYSSKVDAPVIDSIDGKRTKITYAKSKKKRTLSLKWKKIDGASKYIVKCSRDKKFKKKVVKKTVKSCKCTIKKLKSKKKYYIKVIGFTKMGAGAVYSKWSKVKKVKIK